MYLLGVHLPDHKLVRVSWAPFFHVSRSILAELPLTMLSRSPRFLHSQIALQNFYGISDATARRLCARLLLHGNAKVSELSESQVTELSAYLSSPGSIAARKPTPTSIYPSGSSLAQRMGHDSKPASEATSDPLSLPPSQRPSASLDPLRSLVIEADLRRQVQANILHHKTVGSYKGRRHAGGFPVRGQRTQSNAETARKLNRIERRGMHTSASAPSHSGSVSEAVERIARQRFADLLAKR
jgi:small subunit ribosomal protein S13